MNIFNGKNHRTRRVIRPLTLALIQQNIYTGKYRPSKVGPRTLPCGTPLVMCTVSDRQPEMFTTWVLFDKNALNHSNKSSQIP